MKPLLIACDFDGTITQRDTLHVIVEHFGAPERWDEIEPRVRSGAITVEEALQLEFDTVRADPDAVQAVVEQHAPIRAGFADFVRWSRDRGHGLVVCSNGFRSIIDPVLARAGLGDLDVVANDATFGSAGTVIHWADRGRRCDLCNRPCKRAPIAARLDGRILALVGDGISDRCAAGLADIVFARDGLAEDMVAQGRDYIAFDDFDDVRAALTRLEVAA